jgi:ABC-type multidrug transport system fused ATPase/permease subunit
MQPHLREVQLPAEGEEPALSVPAAVRAAFGVLDPGQRRTAALLLVLATASAFLEAVGLSSVVPFVNALSLSEGGGGWLIERGAALLAAVPEDRRALTAAGVVLLVFTVKNLVFTLTVRLQIGFALLGYARASKALLALYLSRPWREHARERAAEQLRDVVDETQVLYRRLILEALMLTTQALTAAAILVVLIVVTGWVGAFVLLLLGGAATGLYFGAQRRGRAEAANRTEQKAHMIRWVTDGLASLKEARVLDTTDAIVLRYDGAVDGFARSGIFNDWLQKLSRPILETVGIAGIVGFIALSGAASDGNLLVGLATFAVAAARLVPAVRSLTSHLVNMRHFAPAARVAPLLERAHRDQARPAVRPLARELALRDVRVQYEGRDQPALDGVTLTLRAGEALGIIGDSGAGKTTLVDVMLGLTDPDGGSVDIDGEQAVAPFRIEGAAYVPQRCHLMDASVRENVAFGREVDDARVWRVLEEAELAGFVRDHPDGLDARVGERGLLFSGGQAQRLGIARALYGGPSLLVLDEATSALDADTERAVLDRLLASEPRPTLVLISHRASAARRCDRLVVFEAGKLSDKGSADAFAGRLA